MSKKSEHYAVKVIYVLGLVLFGLFLISPFLIPIVFAATISLAMYPLQLMLENKGVRRKLAAGILTTTFAVVISIPFSFFLAKGTIAVTQQLEKFQTDARYRNQGVQSIIQTLKEQLIDGLHFYSESLGIDTYLTDARIDSYFVKVNSFFLNFFQDIAAGLPTVFLFFLVMIACTYSFLKNAEGIRKFFQSLLGLDEPRMEHLIRIFITDSRQVYVTNIVTGGFQSLCVAIGVASLGLGDFFLVFFITLILSFIPVIGAAPVAFVFGIIAFFKGETTAAIIIVCVGMFTGVIDNVLRPYLASMGESRIPPIAAFVCVIGGAIVFGFPGLFIGLLIGSFAYDTLPFFWDEVVSNNTKNVAPIIVNDEIDE